MCEIAIMMFFSAQAGEWLYVHEKENKILPVSSNSQKSVFHKAKLFFIFFFFLSTFKAICLVSVIAVYSVNYVPHGLANGDGCLGVLYVYKVCVCIYIYIFFFGGVTIIYIYI